MNEKKWIVGVLVVLLAATSSLAIYYRTELVRLKREGKQAEHQPASTGESPGKVVTKNTVEGRAPEAVKPAARPAPEATPATPSAAEAAATEPQSADSRRAAAEAMDRARRVGTAWLETMRSNNPAWFDAFQQRRREMQERAETAWVNTMDYFSSRDTTYMSEKDFDEYNQMMTVIEQTRDLATRLQAELPHEERHEVMRSVWSNMFVLSPMLEREKDRELYDMARAMGHNSSEAASMVTYVNQIASNTSMNAIFPGPSPRGFTFRGMGPGGGGPPPGRGGQGGDRNGP